ncbi:turripeptide OL11-like [Macrobrachium nipponense]|uniref:turripeptide OL11-like n=1 Tax=Macrobrachium nipponense TaxID=159736 RepID=UPI0030C8980F
MGLLSAVLLVSLFAIFSTSEAKPDKIDQTCTNRICTLDYRPICGSDGHTYPNMCLFNLTKRCDNPKLTIRCHGKCSQCGYY